MEESDFYKELLS